MSARVTSFYITTQDETDKSHTYRLPVTETVPVGEEVIAVRRAGVNRFSSLLSPDSLVNLKSAVSRKR